MKSDHCIVTNFEGDIAIYRGQDLEKLILEVANTELKDYPEELYEFLKKSNPTVDDLIELIEDSDTGIFYDAPRNY